MKKLLTRSLLFVCLLTLLSCGAVQSPPPDSADTPQADTCEAAPVMICSNGTQIQPYANFVWAETWTEQGWLSMSGNSISRQNSGIHHLFPQAVYHEDFALQYAGGVTPTAMAIYSEGGELLHRNATLSDLAELAEGAYDLVITVKVQGKYIESEDRHESAGYEYACRLTVLG
ncbi:MAG: hypothetical protein IJC15_01895 [Clostridia bacterium]|nr:hypothetical protein [Clostridia bacterium]